MRNLTYPRRGPWASLIPLFILGLVVVYHGVASLRWLEANPLPNGYQNEILHLSNALDLFVVTQFKNTELIHIFLFEGYWPPLVYVTSLLPVGILGPSRDAFVLTNGIFLILLLGSVYALTKRLFDGPTALVAATLVSFFPSVYGNLVRFEPNVPLMAIVTLGVYALVRSDGFSRWGWSIAFGLVSGAGMLVDRLAYAFFLWAPALWAFAQGLRAGRGSTVRRRALLRHGIWCVIAFLLVAGYYHSFFFALHSEEIFSQAAAGEIIETGELTEQRDPLSFLTLLFYPLTLADAQVGPGLALALLPALIFGGIMATRRRDRRLILMWILGALLAFTLIQKKQIFYTIPILPGVAILGAAGIMGVAQGALRYVYLAVILGLCLNQHVALMTGEPLISDNGRGMLGSAVRVASGRSPIPESWVSPRYPQARPPDGQDMGEGEILAAIDELRDGLPVFRIGVYSEDPVLFEGYLHFMVRAGEPYLRVNGLVTNVQAFYEWAEMMDLFIYAAPATAPPWPDADRVNGTLESFHRQNENYPAADRLESLEEAFTLRRTLTLESGAVLRFYTPPLAEELPEATPTP